MAQSNQPFYGVIPQGASTNVNDLFANLNEFQFRGIGFPVISFTTRLRQDLAIHKFADKDGAHIESTGRAPLETTARIPLLNGLSPGPHETWKQQGSPLYPTVFRSLFEAFANRQSGNLQHPEFGPITVKTESAEVKWDATVRSGVYIDAIWLESEDDDTDLNRDLSNPSPTANASAAASDLDFNLTTTNPRVTPTLVPPATSFSTIVTAIRSAFDQATLLEHSAGGQIANLIYQANALLFSVNSAANASCLNWPLLDSIALAKSAAYDLQATLLTKNKPVGLYTVVQDSTLAQIANILNANVADIMQLNPQLVQLPVIPQGTVVRFYTQ